MRKAKRNVKGKRTQQKRMLQAKKRRLRSKVKSSIRNQENNNLTSKYHSYLADSVVLLDGTTFHYKHKLHRGKNTEQMGTIARNCGLNKEEARRFYSAVRRFNRFRFEAKMCFEASQEFLLYSDLNGVLEYREGFYLDDKAEFIDGKTRIQPIHHGWLEWNGKILDLMLGFDRDVKSSSHKYIPYFSGDNKRSIEVVKQREALTVDGKGLPLFNNPTCLNEEELVVMWDISNNMFFQRKKNKRECLESRWEHDVANSDSYNDEVREAA